MSIVVTERLESRRLTASREGKASYFELSLNVQGTMSEHAAKVAADQASPLTWGVGQPLFWKQSVSVEVVGESLWLATVRYDTTAPEPLSAENSFEFDTSGGTERITQSLSTVSSSPGGAPNFQGAIGVSDSGVEGVDVVVPRLTFSETRYLPELAPGYKATLFALTSRVNAAPFRGLEAGEVLFLGAQARRQDSRYSTPWVVTYQFAAQKTRRNFFVGSIEVAEKLGWDYLWVRYGREVDSSANALVRVPQSVHIERVYELADFSALGIG